MKWVAIDLGGSYVKASVKSGYLPSRLTYSRGDYHTSQFSASVVALDKEHLYMGDDTILAELLYPESLVLDWRQHELREQIGMSFLGQIKEAAQELFPKEEIGAILIHDKVEPEPWLRPIGEGIFGRDNLQMAMGAKELLSSIDRSATGYAMVVDFGCQSLKITLSNNSSPMANLSHWESQELGFASIDLSSMIEEWPIGVEFMPFGRMMERVRESLNLGQEPALPRGLIRDKALLHEHFMEELRRYAKRCFEECRQRLERLNLGWSDLSELLLVGGAAQGRYLNTLFSEHLRGEGCHLTTYNSQHAEFDATYAMVHAAVKNRKSENSKVVVEF